MIDDLIKELERLKRAEEILYRIYLYKEGSSSGLLNGAFYDVDDAEGS